MVWKSLRCGLKKHSEEMTVPYMILTGNFVNEYAVQKLVSYETVKFSGLHKLEERFFDIMSYRYRIILFVQMRRMRTVFSAPLKWARAGKDISRYGSPSLVLDMELTQVPISG